MAGCASTPQRAGLSTVGCAEAVLATLPAGLTDAEKHCVALAIIDVFLRLNGFGLAADELDAVDTIQSLAAGDLTEDQLADWIANHSVTIR
jgi:hypothetical protein